MGYRSQVAFVIRKDRLEAFIGKLPETVLDLVSQADQHETEEACLYHFDWVKWYGDGEETAESQIEDLIDGEFSQDAFFIRLGEEDGDLTELGDWYGGGGFDLSYTRRLTFSVAPTP